MKKISSAIRIIPSAFLLFVALYSGAQNPEKPTQSFIVAGAIKTPLTIQTADLKKWTLHQVGDVVITNHLGEKRSDAKKLRGVLLKDILQEVEIPVDHPRVLSEYYFVCKANDNYTVVYSWNELFNSAVGESVYIITEKNGSSIDQMEDAILMLSAKDYKTGRRHLKALASIQVKRATNE